MQHCWWTADSFHPIYPANAIEVEHQFYVQIFRDGNIFHIVPASNQSNLFCAKVDEFN